MTSHPEFDQETAATEVTAAFKGHIKGKNGEFAGNFNRRKHQFEAGSHKEKRARRDRQQIQRLQLLEKGLLTDIIFMQLWLLESAPRASVKGQLLL